MQATKCSERMDFLLEGDEVGLRCRGKSAEEEKGTGEEGWARWRRGGVGEVEERRGEAEEQVLKCPREARVFM